MAKAHEFTSEFKTSRFIQVCLGKPSHENRQRWTLDISVFPWLRKQRPRFAQRHWSYCPDEWKVEKAECQHAPICAITRQHGPTLQFVSCAEKDSLWWNSHHGPELKMFGSMPWCSFPWQKLLPRLAQNCCTVQIWSMSSHPCFLPKVTLAGLPGKTFPRKHTFVDINVFLWLRKHRPRFAQGQPKSNFQLKELHRTIKAYSQMNPDWKVEKGQYAEFNVPTCGKIAVWQLCKETQPLSPLWNGQDSWWPELKMFGSMPRCSFPWQKLVSFQSFTSVFKSKPDLYRFA